MLRLASLLSMFPLRRSTNQYERSTPSAHRNVQRLAAKYSYLPGGSINTLKDKRSRRYDRYQFTCRGSQQDFRVLRQSRDLRAQQLKECGGSICDGVIRANTNHFPAPRY